MRLELIIVSGGLFFDEQRGTVDTDHLSMKVCSRLCSAVFGPTHFRVRQFFEELLYFHTRKVPRYP